MNVLVSISIANLIILIYVELLKGVPHNSSDKKRRIDVLIIGYHFVDQDIVEVR